MEHLDYKLAIMLCFCCNTKDQKALTVAVL